MCKQQRRAPEALQAAEGIYEGQTIRLDQQHHRHGAFPYWTLWLIWPLLVLVKWLIPFSWGMFVAIMGAMSGSIGAAVAIVLIVFGVALLLRR